MNPRSRTDRRVEIDKRAKKTNERSGERTEARTGRVKEWTKKTTGTHACTAKDRRMEERAEEGWEESVKNNDNNWMGETSASEKMTESQSRCPMTVIN